MLTITYHHIILILRRYTCNRLSYCQATDYTAYWSGMITNITYSLGWRRVSKRIVDLLQRRNKTAIPFRQQQRDWSRLNIATWFALTSVDHGLFVGVQTLAERCVSGLQTSKEWPEDGSPKKVMASSVANHRIHHKMPLSGAK